MSQKQSPDWTQGVRTTLSPLVSHLSPCLPFLSRTHRPAGLLGPGPPHAYHPHSAPGRLSEQISQRSPSHDWVYFPHGTFHSRDITCAFSYLLPALKTRVFVQVTVTVSEPGTERGTQHTLHLCAARKRRTGKHLDVDLTCRKRG